MYNRLLKKQIRRKLGGEEKIPSEMLELLSAISDSYDHYEKDRTIISRAMMLEQQESNLEKENTKLKAKSEFLSTMSHEIRTPLNAVVGITNVLLMDVSCPDIIEDLNTLKFSADTLLSLINNVLDFSKIEHGHIAIEKLEFNLRNLVSNLTQTFLVKTKKKGIDLLIEIDKDVPNFVVGDQLRLNQILLNLVGNSIKFTSNGYVKIRIQKLKQDVDDVNLEFSIIDTGIGIPAAKHDLIFENFQQADINTSRSYGGTGLGLPITKKLLDLMGSHIEIESEVGIGSRFFFDLNLELRGSSSRSSVVQKDDVEFDAQKILLVDDNKINLMVAKRFLDRWGLRVDTALNGEQALNAVQSGDYDLVLMDLNMPVMDGYTATHKIRSLSDSYRAQIPIIALTASADDVSKTRITDAGMNAFLSKPFEPLKLKQLIKQCMVASTRRRR